MFINDGDMEEVEPEKEEKYVYENKNHFQCFQTESYRKFHWRHVFMTDLILWIWNSCAGDDSDNAVWSSPHSVARIQIPGAPFALLSGGLTQFVITAPKPPTKSREICNEVEE